MRPDLSIPIVLMPSLRLSVSHVVVRSIRVGPNDMDSGWLMMVRDG